MRNFTPEEFNRIEMGGYVLLPSYFPEGTLGKKLALEIIKCINNENIIDKKIVDELVFYCYSNGAQPTPITSIIPKESFNYVENFKKTLSEIKSYICQNYNDKSNELIYKAFIVLYLNNIIRIHPESDFQNNLVIDRNMYYFLPSVTSTINFIDMIIDLIDHQHPAFILFLNNQDNLVGRILTTKIKTITEKEQQIAIKLKESEDVIEKLNTDNEIILAKNKELVQNNEKDIEKNRANIITIVSLISTIIPFFIVNISVLVNSFNIVLLICINGTMLLVVGVVYYFVNNVNMQLLKQHKKTDNKKPYKAFITIGIIMLIVGIALWILAATICPIKDFIILMSLK